MIAFLSVQFSGTEYIRNIEQTPHLVVVVEPLTRVSLQSQGLQHTRLLCPSLSPGAAQIPVHSVSDAN